MMKRFRLIVSAAAVLALTAGSITGIGALPASAATVTLTLNNITYTADSTDRAAGATAVSYSGVGGAVAIAVQVRISGVLYDVRSIGSSAFSNKEITAVTIPDGVDTIGDLAFAGNRLTSVTIPNGFGDIGSAAFADNTLLTSVVFAGGIPTITAADPSAGSFGAAAGKTLYFYQSFYYPGALWNGYTAAVEPAPVTDTINNVTYSAYTTRPNDGATITAYDGAGGAVTLLDRVKISGVDYDVTSIGDEAFERKAVTAVKLPAKVTLLGQSSFAFNSLTTVIIPAGVTVIRAFSFLGNDLTTVTIPIGIASIGDWAFRDNHLTSVTLPNSLVMMGHSVFKYNRLTSVTIPGSVGLVGYETFAYNWLSSVTIRDGVSEISMSAFEGNRLTAVTIPASVNLIQYNAFDRNPLTSALFMGTTPSATFQDGGGLYGAYGPFGRQTGKTLYYLAANATGFTSPWNGYTTAVAKTFTAFPTPTITGTKKSGSTLTAVTGTWRPTPTTLSYVWSRADTSTGEKTTIVGATSKTYKLTTADKGKFITVTVTASKIGYADTVKTSADGGTKIAS